MGARSKDERPCYEDPKRYGTCIDEQPHFVDSLATDPSNSCIDVRGRTDRDALNFSMGVLDCEVIEGEHAVKGFGEELDLETLAVNPELGCVELYGPQCIQ